jgi:presenilin-like A22 family membrane protease
MEIEMKNRALIKKILPIIIGGIAGYAYYCFIGCRTGSCPISGNPYISTAYGAIVGLIFAFPYRKNHKIE